MKKGEWREIPGAPGYTASDDGRLAGPRGKVLRTRPNHGGYPIVTIRRRTVRVHRLVAATFLGPIPAGREVNHIDGSRNNNAVSNLEYVTRSENMLHAGRMGRLGKGAKRGAANPRAKLSDEEMLLLDQLYYLREWTSRELGEAFGVSSSRVRKIASRNFGLEGGTP